jgi:hypothetical protein
VFNKLLKQDKKYDPKFRVQVNTPLFANAFRAWQQVQDCTIGLSRLISFRQGGYLHAFVHTLG